MSRLRAGELARLTKRAAENAARFRRLWARAPTTKTAQRIEGAAESAMAQCTHTPRGVAFAVYWWEFKKAWGPDRADRADGAPGASGAPGSRVRGTAPKRGA